MHAQNSIVVVAKIVCANHGICLDCRLTQAVYGDDMGDPNAAPAARYFQPRRLGHVNLVVSDTERSMRFYNAVAGFEEAYRVAAIKGGFLSNGNTHHDIGMVESSGPSGRGRPPGLNHLAFELETEVDLVHGYNRAIADGLSFDRTLDHDISHSAYASDPDGNQCETYADVIRDWRDARNGVVTKPKPVWYPGLTEPCTERNYEIAPEIRRVEEAVFHPLRTKHATLVVSDMAAAVDFYTRRQGLRVLAGGASRPLTILGGTCGERNLALLRAHADLQPGLHHIGFELRDDADLDASLTRLKADGGSVDLHIEHPLRRAVFIRDPDGLRLQFFIDRPAPDSAWEDLDPQLALFLA